MMDETRKKDAVLLAMLPEVPFDGWTRAALRAAAARAGVDAAELHSLFPKGSRDVAAWFSRWADRKTLEALTSRKQLRRRTRERVAHAVKTRLDIASRAPSVPAFDRGVARGPFCTPAPSRDGASRSLRALGSRRCRASEQNQGFGLDRTQDPAPCPNGHATFLKSA